MKALKNNPKYICVADGGACRFMMMITIVSVSTFDRADRNLFGYKAFIVLSDSMEQDRLQCGRFGARESG